jgi:hypothetical protein
MIGVLSLAGIVRETRHRNKPSHVERKYSDERLLSAPPKEKLSHSSLVVGGAAIKLTNSAYSSSWRKAPIRTSTVALSRMSQHFAIAFKLSSSN